MRVVLLLMLIKLLSVTLNAQQSKENIVEDIVEGISESLTESSQSELPDELNKLASSPIDLNTDEVDLLVIAKLITREQADAIRQYIIQNGKFIEPEELQQISVMDKPSILKILPYSTVYTKKDIKSTAQLVVRYQQSLLKTENYYGGSLSKMLIRFRSTINSSVKCGFTLEKDEGEEMFTRNRPTFDFYSFHILYSGNKLIRKIIVGDYNVETGQGLNMWSGLSFGSASLVTSIYKYGRGVVPYSGTDENRFYRGAAIALEKRNISLDAWISYHKVDANVVTVPSGDKHVTSLQYSGYHRSYSEMTDYHSQTEYAAGIHLKYKFRNGEIGAVSSAQQFEIPITGSTSPYARYGFRGISNINSGIHYSYTIKNIILFGEESICSNGTIASVNGILVSADPKFSYAILYRNYPVTFHNMKSNAFGVNSANSNEQGIYVAVNYTFLKPITYSGFMDIFTFPFLKYKVDAPSNGNEWFHQLEFKPTRKMVMQVRYRERKKQENTSADSEDNSSLTEYNYRSIRFASTIKLDNDWTYGMRVEFMNVNSITTWYGQGTMISQDLLYHPMGKKYSFTIRYAVFDCKNFESRIYQYENDVQGAFSVPFYYGNGNRFYINSNLHIGKKINLSVRYAMTLQENEKDYSPKSDVKLQLRLSL